jgi:transcriptional regulator with XRE-family HTH domain
VRYIRSDRSDSNRRKDLAIARKKARLTQRQLADQLGVNRVTLARWELGESDPSLAKALEIARILGKRVEQLFGDEPLFSQEEVDRARRLQEQLRSLRSATGR